MHLVCVGISHHTAPLALREKLAMNREQVDAALADLHARHPQAELAILSTCNRTEVYVARPLHGHPRIEQVIQWLADRHHTLPDTLHESLYHYDNERAIRHLFRVACGLDSMVVGERQIVQQVKQAYDAAQRAETAGKALHRLFQLALAAGKRIRSATGLDAGGASVATVAVEFARHLFERLDDKTLGCIGAGKINELVLRQFMRLKPRRIMVCNRSPDHAEALAAKLQTVGIAVQITPFDQLDDLLAEADVAISSTGAGESIITAQRMRAILKRRRFRPVFLIDLAVPRDVEPAVADLPNVYRFDLDDLQRTAADQRGIGPDQLEAAERMVEQAVGECYALVQTGDVSDLIRRLQRQVQNTGREEVRRTIHKLLAVDPQSFEKILDEHTHRLINKILHKPLTELGRGDSRSAALYATALRRLFNLDAEDLAPPEDTRPAAQRKDQSEPRD